MLTETGAEIVSDLRGSIDICSSESWRIIFQYPGTAKLVHAFTTRIWFSEPCYVGQLLANHKPEYSFHD